MLFIPPFEQKPSPLTPIVPYNVLYAASLRNFVATVERTELPQAIRLTNTNYLFLQPLRNRVRNWYEDAK